VLTHRASPLTSAPRPPAALTLTLTRSQLLAVLSGLDPGEIGSEGDHDVLLRLLSLTTVPDRLFPVVTP
jgi:hypothetical protein